jgi:MFS family permease
MVISNWHGGTVQGYGLVLFVGVIFGVIGLICQSFQIDINPKQQNINFVKILCEDSTDNFCEVAVLRDDHSIPFWKNTNFLIFLVYLSLWMISVNLSSPFFSLYLLDNLNIGVNWLTIYSSLQVGASMVVLMFWGKLTDKIGNRTILIFIGILVAFQPLLWLGIHHNTISILLLLPLLYLLTGAAAASLDLCINNLQLGIAPVKNQSFYFAITAAVGGVSGALGTTIGGFIAQFLPFDGLLGLFTISSALRLLAIIPLIFLQDPKYTKY